MIMLFLMTYEMYKSEDALDYSSLVDSAKRIFPGKEIQKPDNLVGLDAFRIAVGPISLTYSNTLLVRMPNISTDPPLFIQISFPSSLSSSTTTFQSSRSIPWSTTLWMVDMMMSFVIWSSLPIPSNSSPTSFVVEKFLERYLFSLHSMIYRKLLFLPFSPPHSSWRIPKPTMLRIWSFSLSPTSSVFAFKIVWNMLSEMVSGWF